MRTVTGKRIGQSGPELFSAVLFSSVLHVLVFTCAFILFGMSTPRTFVPPAYRVTLVSEQPGNLPPVPAATAPVPAKPVEELKTPQKTSKAPKGTKESAKKGGMPELKAKKAAPEREYVAEDRPEAPAKPAGKPQGAVVALSAPQEVKFSPYVGIVREKIERNWNPPPGAKETKATVTFRIGRSGRVVDANLMQPSGNFYFDQAAMRAILASGPFPPLPDGYFKDTMDFSVDLMANE